MVDCLWKFYACPCPMAAHYCGCAAAEGNSLSLAPAARASSLAREPFCRSARTVRQGKESFGRENFPTTWISWYTAPSRGSCREAEGVAFRRSATTMLHPHLKELPSTLAGIAVMQPPSRPCPPTQNILFSGLTFRTIWFVPTTSTSPTSDWNNPTAADFSSVPPSSAR